MRSWSRSDPVEGAGAAVLHLGGKSRRLHMLSSRD